MKFLLDENFPKAATALLRGKGHEVFDFRQTKNQGMEDIAVFEFAQKLGAVLLTTDRDFFHTIPHLFEIHCGVVVVALRQPNRHLILSKLEWLLSQIEESKLKHRVFHLRDHTWLVYPPLD